MKSLFMSWQWGSEVLRSDLQTEPEIKDDDQEGDSHLMSQWNSRCFSQGWGIRLFGFRFPSSISGDYQNEVLCFESPLISSAFFPFPWGSLAKNKNMDVSQTVTSESEQAALEQNKLVFDFIFV